MAQASTGLGLLTELGQTAYALAPAFLTATPASQRPGYTPGQLEALWYPKLTDCTEQLVETNLGLVNIYHGGQRDGPALVLWPSLMMKGSMWAAQYEYYRRTHFVVLIDSPGINKSEDLRRYCDLQDCKDVVVKILDTLKIDKCVFGGNSWGAMLASVLPAWIPERLHATLVFNGTASRPTTVETIVMTLLSEAMMMCETMPNWWPPIATQAFASNSAEASNPDFLAYVGGVSREDPKSVAWALKGILLGRKDTHRLLSTIKDIPVLVIAGKEDRQFSIPTCKSMADAIPTCKFVVIDHVGHLAGRERPDLVNKEIDAFMLEHGFKPGGSS